MTDGHEVIPAWRIATPRADWVILSRFDHAEPSRQDWVLHQMRRFMARTFAQSFIVSGQMGPSSAALVRSSEEAIVGLAASRSERLVLRQPVLREPSLTFGKLQSMECSLVQDSYWELLPARRETISPEEEEELDRIFGIDGELSARWL